MPSLTFGGRTGLSGLIAYCDEVANIKTLSQSKQGTINYIYEQSRSEAHPPVIARTHDVAILEGWLNAGVCYYI